MKQKEKRSLGFFVAVSLVIGNMIGSGIFLLPATLASIGTITIYSWLVSSVGAILLALVFSKLSMSYPFTGGPYVYCKEGFGEFIGFQVAYSYWIYLGIGIAAIAVAFTGYLGALFPFLQESALNTALTSIGIVWIMTFINIVGIRFAGRFQLIVTILKLIPLLMVIIGGYYYFNSDNLFPLNISAKSDFGALSTGTMLTLWAFLGLESACIPADEVKNPKRTIPLATIIGTAFASIIYILSTLVLMGSIPLEKLATSSAPFAMAAGIIYGGFGKYLIIVGALVGCIGTLNGWILLQSQMALAASKDELFPTIFSSLNENRTPVKGLVVSSIFISAFLLLTVGQSLVSQFTLVISIATFAAIIAFLYTMMSEIVLSARKGLAALKHSWIAVLAFMFVYWVISSADISVVYYGLLLVLSSVFVYGWMKVKEKISEQPEKDI